MSVAFTLSSGVFAQEKMDKKMDKNMDHNMGMKKDCVMMEDGKMMVMKGGNTMAMDKDMKMSNGTMVMTNGTVKMKNGKTMMMKDGDCMYGSAGIVDQSPPVLADHVMPEKFDQFAPDKKTTLNEANNQYCLPYKIKVVQIFGD